MKVVFDHQIYVEQDYGGISRYFYELSKGLGSEGIEVENTTLVSNNIYTLSPQYRAVKFFSGKKFKGKAYFLKRLNQIYSIFKLRGDWDIFHPTYYDTYFLDHLEDRPFVITVYDLIHEKFDYKSLSADKTIISRRQRLLNKSAKIIAISHSTKNDIIEYYKIAPEKIKVIHLANSLPVSKKTENFVYSGYLLYVGLRADYKNFNLFIEAVAPLLNKENKLNVICAGGGKFNSAELSIIQGLGLEGKVIQVTVDDLLLSALYTNALMFVFPSLYEGFGLPVLEAFKCSCPVVMSNAGSLTEIGGDGAEYFNPYDKEDILAKVSLLLYNGNLRKKMISKGLQIEKGFSWDNTVKRHAELYKSLV